MFWKYASFMFDLAPMNKKAKTTNSPESATTVGTILRQTVGIMNYFFVLNEKISLKMVLDKKY